MLSSAMPRLKGFLSYLIPVLKTFVCFRPPLLEVRADGQVVRGNMMMVELMHLDGELRESGAHECTVTVEPRCLTVLVAR